MKVQLECMYCGNKWDKIAHTKQSIESETCPKCNDSSLKVRDHQASKIDTYKGCPPFLPKKREDPDWTFMGMDLAFGVDRCVSFVRNG